MNANFPAKTSLRPIFLALSSLKKTQVAIYESPKGIVKNIEHGIRSFLWDLRGRWKQFLKKGCFTEEKQFWSLFSRITEYGRPQVIFCWAPQGILEITLQVIGHFRNT